MAKKKNQEKNDDGLISKLISGFFVILIVLVWLVILAALIRFDVGGFGSSVLRPILKDVPVINKILPEPTDEEIAEEARKEGDENQVATLAQAKELIAKLQEENEKLVSKNKALKEDKNDLSKEIERLKVFEEKQNEFQTQKEEFYREIVYGENAPSADTYSKWYESIDAAHAEAIYRQVVADQAVSDEVKKVAKTYENMKPSEAAATLEKVGNLDVVAEVLSAMKADSRAKVMDQMDKNLAASVTKKLMP